MGRKGERYVEKELVNDSGYYKGKIVKQFGFAVVAFIVTFLISGIILEMGGGISDTGFRVILGIVFMSVPSGWSALSAVFGKWIIGNLPAFLMVMAIKLVLSIILGWILFPITLVYNIVKLVKKSKEENEDMELV